MDIAVQSDPDPHRIHHLLPAPPLTHTIDLQVNYAQRTIYMDEIEDASGQWFAMILGEFGAESLEPVTLMLNTPGGDVTSMFAIVDLMRASPIPVHTVGYGQVCSAGVLMLASGELGHRSVTDSCMWMAHESWGFGSDGTMGITAAKSRRIADDYCESQWTRKMAEVTPHSSDYWAEKIAGSKEFWLLGGEAIVKGGVADRVV